MATLGTKLARLRKEKKLTQQQMAEELNVSQNAYNKWESDKTKPSMENIMKLADFHDTSVYDFFDDKATNINSVEKNKGMAFIIGNDTVNIQSPELLEALTQNLKSITQLVEAQNKIIEQLLKK